MSFKAIDLLLEDKLYQVIGSTPRSIAESLLKVDFKGKVKEGSQMFALSVFAAAVNKSTLETFMADNRFAEIRPLVQASLSIQGRSNMTALTLLGHCLLTTEAASSVRFTSEFRKKMGQENIWDGDLTKGSLSDKQKEILKEKKRLTDEKEAKALGSGFLKLTGLDNKAMTALEAEMFKQSVSVPTPPSRPAPRAETRPSTSAGKRQTSPTDNASDTQRFVTSTGEEFLIPLDVMNYRRNIIGQNDYDIEDSIRRHGFDGFVSNTRSLARSDPTGERMKSASTVGRS